MLDPAELAAWLRLTESLGAGSVRRLLAMAGNPEAALRLPAAALDQALTAKQREAFNRPPEHLDELFVKAESWLAEPGHDLLVLGDPDYPPRLLATADPPLLLWLQGRRELLGTPSIAIVGSRNPTAQGGDNARAFGRALAGAGYTVISGLALGVDAAAHEGALDATGTTIAVVGTGLDQVYPRRNADLAARLLAGGGLIVSEYSLGTPITQANFPKRNRIIAGLSEGCLVVEAAVQSGSLITARLAVEAGREVFAIPGSIHSPQARGCHALIRQGAKLVESAQDVLEELRPLATPREKAPEMPETPHEQQALLDAMGFDPVSLDALMARSGWPAAELSGALLELELDGRVARLAGQLFQRRGQG
ncbi:MULTISPECIES: DNA-processing protein DprA [unclassified Roseateles]|uniref:DNA-processing protein DprA n=1 Tax=unclassified Roseateles TaxID=2626991 RepID=UPI0006FAE513|nr:MULTISPECIES: DNA-processing protein DprA [unclassified Roseateles]KQW51288.1 DNA processing protein DprA [Pelomonas sp. Root405]KRA77520.1 DNA processing protein DprA [Pelomonas sp. Root662]